MHDQKQIFRVKATLTIVDVNYVAAIDLLDAYRQEEELLRLSGDFLTGDSIDKGALTLENEVVDAWQLLDVINDVPLRITENITTQQLKDELKYRKRSEK